MFIEALIQSPFLTPICVVVGISVMALAALGGVDA